MKISEAFEEFRQTEIRGKGCARRSCGRYSGKHQIV